MTSPETSNSQEPDKNLLLEKINKALLEMGSKAQYLKVPEDYPEYQALKGKKVLMLDDVKGLLEAFIPDLMVATNGNASYIFHKGETPEEVAKQIIEQNPDLALLDYSLSGGVTGTDIYELLKENGFAGKPIGFSSDKNSQGLFKKAGVEDCVDKDTFDTGAVVKEIAKLAEKQDK